MKKKKLQKHNAAKEQKNVSSPQLYIIRMWCLCAWSKRENRTIKIEQIHIFIFGG